VTICSRLGKFSSKKEGKMERRTIWLTGMLILVLLLGVGISLAGVDRTAGVSATATVGSSTSLSVQAKNISNNASVSSISFGVVSATNKLAPQYVEIQVASNFGSWELEIYTDNFSSPPNTNIWGYQYGGMTGNTAGNRVPMVWQAYRTTTSVSDPPTSLSGWTYVKDQSDLDIPGTPSDESWATAHSDGYTNIAFGGPDYLMVVEPNGSVLDSDNKLMVYVGGLFGSASADSYSTTVGIDLYHE